ncbi:DMT family transporter [Paracoccaceae bacterium]|nr:DMT family transporter [Paracoccaceae bacterium]
MAFKHILLGVGFALIWASAFPSAKLAVQFCPPFFFLFLRFLSGGIFSVSLGIFLGQKLQFSRKTFIWMIFFGLIQNGLYLGLVFFALTMIDANISVIIASILPLTVAFFSWLFFKTNISSTGIIGLIVGILGVLLIMLQRVGKEYEIVGMALCFIALLATTIATLIINKLNIRNDNIMIVIGLQMLAGSLFLFPITYVYEDWKVHLTPLFFFTFFYVAIVPGILGPLIWFYLQKEIGAIKYSSFHFLVPLFGIGISYLLLGETLTYWDILGVIVVITGLYLVNKEKRNT